MLYLHYCALIACCLLACNRTTVAPGVDPFFEIVPHQDKGFRACNRKVVVFGIPIYAFKEVQDQKLLHAANIMAQYLDNDEDGTIDNALVWEQLISDKAALFLWKFEHQIRLPAQDLGNDETQLKWHQNGQIGRFDAALEEVWHVVSHSGYSKVYPAVFGEQKGSKLTEAMDIARGGFFKEVPTEYPALAWYSYDDRSCHYSCMATEYFYWGITSLLGAQRFRQHEIQQEWKLHTPELLQSKDSLLFQLLTDTLYKLPQVLPDGSYRH